jgi:glucose/arabinose dehydrogenase
LVCVCVLATFMGACDKKEETPASQEAPAGTITGRERLGWDQQAPDAAELGEYTFALYVDGTPFLLSSATCGALAGDGPTAACSSPLPVLRPGAHTLELGTRIVRGGVVLESARSAPLVVTVAGSGTASSALQAARTRGNDPGGDAAYVVEAIVEGLDGPSSLAKLPDGRLLIAERRGVVRIAQNGLLRQESAVVLADVDAEGGDRVTLAIDRDFARTRFVYVAYAARDSGGGRNGKVVRFREAGGTLGEPAAVVDGLPAEAGPPRVRIGPDGALYISTAALHRGDADDLAKYAGKVLRFTAEGATPADNPIRSSPVFSFGSPGQPDVGWEPASEALWHIESDGGGVSVGRLRAGERTKRAVYLEDIRSADAAFHSGAAPAAWHGSLFLASPDHTCLYRLTGLSSSPAGPAVERVLASGFGRIVALLSADDGLYFATANGGTDGGSAPSDAVFRVRDRTAQR